MPSKDKARLTEGKLIGSKNTIEKGAGFPARSGGGSAVFHLYPHTTISADDDVDEK
jgi:hypothetical protein